MGSLRIHSASPRFPMAAHEDDSIRQKNPFQKWESRAVAQPAITSPLFTRRVSKIIESQGSSFKGRVSENEIADLLTIDSPKRIFWEILSCISPPPFGKFKKPRQITENFTFGTGIICILTDFIFKVAVVGSQILAFKILGSALTAISAAFATANCALGIFEAREFAKKLDQMMLDSSVSEEERAKTLLRLVYDQILISPQEIEKIRSKILDKMPDHSDEERFQALKKSALNLTKSKIKHLKNLVGDKGIKAIINNAEKIMMDLENPSKANEAIKECMKLYQSVKTGNMERQKFYAFMLALSLITFVVAVVTLAMILATVMTGPVGLILLGISIAANILWAVAAHYYIQNMLENKIKASDLLTNPALT